MQSQQYISISKPKKSSHSTNYYHSTKQQSTSIQISQENQDQFSYKKNITSPSKNRRNDYNVDQQQNRMMNQVQEQQQKNYEDKELQQKQNQELKSQSQSQSQQQQQSQEQIKQKKFENFKHFEQHSPLPLFLKKLSKNKTIQKRILIVYGIIFIIYILYYFQKGISISSRYTPTKDQLQQKCNYYFFSKKYKSIADQYNKNIPRKYLQPFNPYSKQYSTKASDIQQQITTLINDIPSWKRQQIYFQHSYHYKIMLNNSQSNGHLNHYPLIPRNSSLPNTPQNLQKMIKRNISMDSYQIAKQFLKLGLKQPSQQLIRTQKMYYQMKYSLEQKFVYQLNSKELPFCVVIASFNNTKNMRYKFSLNTIFRQQYSNYHIVYIDDNSLDQTGKNVQKYMIQRNISKQKYKIIINEQNKYALRNQYQASVNHCGQDQIMMIVDGDDGLLGTQVFKLLNHFYQTTDNWAIYSNFIFSCSNQDIGVSRQVDFQVLKNNKYREQAKTDWCTSQLKTFYNKLLQSANKAYFYELDPITMKQKWFKRDSDRAIFYQIVQMAGTRVKYIPQLLLIYTDQTQNTDGLHFGDQVIRQLNIMSEQKPMKPLRCLFQDNHRKCIQPAKYILKNRS